MDKSAIWDAKDRLVDGLRGHGAHLSLEAAIANFPASLMNERPPNVPYTFWDTLEHIRIAQHDLHMYAASPGHESPEWPSEYWPAPGERADGNRWNATISAIQDERERFIDFVKDPKCDVFAPAEHMDGGSVFRAALLAIDHTAYHLGEFVMGRQILGQWVSELKR